MDEEVLELEESVDDGLDDSTEGVIADPDEIEKPEDLDEQEPQESDKYSEIIAPTEIESVVIEDTGNLNQLEEPTQPEGPVDEHLDALENTGDTTEPEVETPIDSKEEKENEA